MDLDILRNERQEAMQLLRDSLQEELIACEISESEEDGTPDVLNVVLDMIGEGEGAVGEFFFLPEADEELKVQMIQGVITLFDGIKEENLQELFEAMSYINFRLPMGHYCIDKEKKYLVYRLTVPVPADLYREDLLAELNIMVGNAAQMADMYLDELYRISEGELTTAELMLAL